MLSFIEKEETQRHCVKRARHQLKSNQPTAVTAWHPAGMLGLTVVQLTDYPVRRFNDLTA